MSALPRKIHSFLKDIKSLENASPEEREKAVHLLTEALNDNKIYVIKKQNGVKDMAAEIKAARARLEDIHNRLELSIKSGIVSESIH